METAGSNCSTMRDPFVDQELKDLVAQCLFQCDLSLLMISSPLRVSRAVIIAQLSTASTFFTLLSWLPTFFKETFPESKVSWLRGIAGLCAHEVVLGTS